ncbi:MAG TPA: glycosyltransferase [Bacteroidetes bacterium]|nr:glycosyltransferase [Bacteroidota bacterium]
MDITVIVPTFNEEKNIARLLRWLQDTRPPAGGQIIVVDGGSADRTVEVARAHGALAVVSPVKGRAAQMNHGASLAQSNMLYFVHADVLPPKTWAADILLANRQGKVAGCFSYRFDSDKWYLKITEWATRQNWFAVGGGDQTLFVTKKIYGELGGFRSELHIMEDFDFVKRLRKKYPFHIICHNALVSARKYQHNNYLFVQVINALTVMLFNMGFPQKRLARIYRNILKVR